MGNPSILGAIDHVRLLVDAIAAGRIEAKTVKDMTDDQLDEYVSRLRDEARDAVDEGYKMHESPQQ